MLRVVRVVTCISNKYARKHRTYTVRQNHRTTRRIVNTRLTTYSHITTNTCISLWLYMHLAMTTCISLWLHASHYEHLTIYDYMHLTMTTCISLWLHASHYDYMHLYMHLTMTTCISLWLHTSHYDYIHLTIFGGSWLVNTLIGSEYPNTEIVVFKKLGK